jgi:uncharacterized RDD family membrane protein YckC
LPLGMDVADNGARFAAYVIDSIISVLLGLAAGSPCYGLAILSVSSSSSSDAAQVLLYLSVIPMVIAAGWYYVHFHARTGQTPGKKRLHIKVVNQNGDLISTKRALARWLAFTILPAVASAIGCGLPIGYVIYALPLFESQHRALHDLITGTYVVKA